MAECANGACVRAAYTRHGTIEVRDEHGNAIEVNADLWDQVWTKIHNGETHPRPWVAVAPSGVRWAGLTAGTLTGTTVLTYTDAEWDAFVAAVLDGTFTVEQPTTDQVTEDYWAAVDRSLDLMLSVAGKLAVTADRAALNTLAEELRGPSTLNMEETRATLERVSAMLAAALVRYHTEQRDHLAVVQRIVGVRNRFCQQREALREEMQKLTDLAAQAVDSARLQDVESRALLALDRGVEDARRFLIALPPKIDADAQPTAEDREA